MGAVGHRSGMNAPRSAGFFPGTLTPTPAWALIGSGAEEAPMTLLSFDGFRILYGRGLL